jgi:carbon-monoxide dehydrogenase iron sulfur subunit
MLKEYISEYLIYLDAEKCTGCKRCMLSCSVAKSSSKELFTAIYEKPLPWPRIHVQWIHEYTIPMQCRHCEKAPCVEVCPVSALERLETGIIRLKENVCIGCKYCVIACPFGAISLDYYRKLVFKCDLCLDRIEKEIVPACVEACPTGALRFGTFEELIRGVRMEKAEKILSGITIPGKIISEKIIEVAKPVGPPPPIEVRKMYEGVKWYE